jgi:osmotically-inducible protein OsmY
MSKDRAQDNRPPDVESVRTDDRGRWEDDGGNSQVRGLSGYRPDAEGRPDLPGPRPVGAHGQPVGTHRVVEDERLRAAVKDALGRHDVLGGHEIECRCENGEITLTGSVPDAEHKRLAADAVREVEGVRVVHDRLAVVYAAGR